MATNDAGLEDLLLIQLLTYNNHRPGIPLQHIGSSRNSTTDEKTQSVHGK